MGSEESTQNAMAFALRCELNGNIPNRDVLFLMLEHMLYAALNVGYINVYLIILCT